MSVDTDTIRRVARLARIAIDSHEVEQMTERLNTILVWVEQLKEVDVDGIEPMVSVSHDVPVLRTDLVTDGNITAHILANAPASYEVLITVPKVVESSV